MIDKIVGKRIISATQAKFGVCLKLEDGSYATIVCKDPNKEVELLINEGDKNARNVGSVE